MWWSLSWGRSRSWTSLPWESVWLSGPPPEDSLASELGGNGSWHAHHSRLHLPPHRHSCCPVPYGTSVPPPSGRSPQKGRNRRGCPQSLTSAEIHCPWTLKTDIYLFIQFKRFILFYFISKLILVNRQQHVMFLTFAAEGSGSPPLSRQLSAMGVKHCCLRCEKIGKQTINQHRRTHTHTQKDTHRWKHTDLACSSLSHHSFIRRGAVGGV